MSARKTELRSRFDSYRRMLTESEYRRSSDRIIERVTQLPEIRNASVVHLYWPMTERREVDTRPLIPLLRARGKEIVLPVVVTFDASSGEAPRMDHVRYADEGSLRLNRWGIAEPIGCDPVAVEVLDVIVAPALGAGRSGHRIGYGFGYYDEFLAGTAAPKIALVYDACLVDEVPVESHDVAMDILVTESSTIRPQPSRPRPDS